MNIFSTTVVLIEFVIKKLWAWVRLQSLFFTPKSELSLLHFTAGKSVVTGDYLLNLSGSTIKLMFNYIKCSEKRL